jgi:hypothetical protein
MGSMIRWKPIRENLVKTIVRDDFQNYEDMIEFEKALIIDHKDHLLNRNYSVPNSFFYLKKSEDTIGEKNGFFGKNHTESHKLKIAEKLKGKNNPSYGKKWMNKDGQQIYAKPEHIEYYQNEGWVLGSLKSGKAFEHKRVWITDGKENRYIKEAEFLLPDGWRRGKTYSTSAKEKFKNLLSKTSPRSSATKKGAVWMNDGTRNYKLQEEEGVNRGLTRGRLGKPWNKL